MWGPRQTGKSTLLRQLFPGAKTYDLLLSGEYQRLLRNPGILRKECQADGTQRKPTSPPFIIDEVQKIPALLDEVHWLIENLGIRFVLCGSSARKEIAAEALTRNIPAFGRFLEAAAMTNAELVNYANIASECGVSAPSVKEYFQILASTSCHGTIF